MAPQKKIEHAGVVNVPRAVRPDAAPLLGLAGLARLGAFDGSLAFFVPVSRVDFVELHDA